MDKDGRSPFRRAHVFKIEIGANTLDDLVHELHHYATELQRGKVTTGCSGSPSAGTIYSYSHDPEWTKERYFAALDAHLEAEATGSSTPFSKDSPHG